MSGRAWWHVALVATVTSTFAWTGCLLTIDDSRLPPRAGPGADDGGAQDPDGAAPPPTIGAKCGDEAVCALAPPEGWSFRVASFGAKDPCPHGFTGETDRIAVPAPTEGITCTCTCGERLGASSCPDVATLLAGEPLLCGAVTQLISTTCTSVSLEGVPNYMVAAGGPNQAECAVTVDAKKEPVTATVRTCAPETAPTPGTCEDGRTCVAAPSGSYRLCVTHSDPSQPCPTGFSDRRRTGTSVDDTRTCAGCICATTDSCDSSVAFYAVAGCSGPPVFTGSARTCTSFGGVGLTFKSARYEPTLKPGGACQVARPPEPAGDFTVADEGVLCCAP